ncbi:MAG: hypothetical protein ABL907_14930 [Hyphomicrobium sp.]
MTGASNLNASVGRAASRFRQDGSGAVLPLFALMIIVVAGVAGVAIDFARTTRIKARIADAADAANLAAARAAADLAQTSEGGNRQDIIAQAEALGLKYLESNLAGLADIKFNKLDLKVKFTAGMWSSRIDYQAKNSTTLSVALSSDSMDISGTAEASVAPGFPVLDIAMCVDSTGSMQPTLDTVKANAISFYDNLNIELAAKNIPSFPLVRVRMMYFKDFGDGSGIADPDPLVTSAFFELPDKSADFNAFVSPQVAYGGADWPESGLECLNEAMDSPWTKIGDKPAGFANKVTDVYPLIVIWTDASTHRIAYPNSLANPVYPLPAKLPRTYGDLLDKWNDKTVLDQSHKQILFFGDPAQPSFEADGGASGWAEVMNWPNFVLGGTVVEANASMVEFMASGIAKSAHGLKLTN